MIYAGLKLTLLKVNGSVKKKKKKKKDKDKCS